MSLLKITLVLADRKKTKKVRNWEGETETYDSMTKNQHTSGNNTVLRLSPFWKASLSEIKKKTRLANLGSYKDSVVAKSILNIVYL